jgi:hypothetical protein
MTLRLTDLEAPLDDVEFPNGTKHQPVPFGPKEYHLWRDIQREADALARGTALMAIVAACYPTATPDDLESCTPKMLIALAAHAGRKIDQVRDALKNVDTVGAQEEAHPTPPPAAEGIAPSSPRTSGATSASSSRKRSGKTSSTTTTASRTESPSTSGTVFITSTTPNASTHFVESSTTSTAPS